MKRYTVLLILSGCLELGAASFKNLGFESANTNVLTLDLQNNGLVGTVEELLPGWKVFQGTNQLNSLAYNNGSQTFSDNGGGPMVLGLGPSLAPRPIEGGFSFAMVTSGGLTPQPFSIVQRGEVPADARWLAFTHGGETPNVSIDGVTLFEPFPTLRYPADLVLDISQFSGKEVELEFSSPRFPPSGWYVLDGIGFVVPEPGSVALFMVGALVPIAQWGWISRRARKP